MFNTGQRNNERTLKMLGMQLDVNLRKNGGSNGVQTENLNINMRLISYLIQCPFCYYLILKKDSCQREGLAFSKHENRLTADEL